MIAISIITVALSLGMIVVTDAEESDASTSKTITLHYFNYDLTPKLVDKTFTIDDDGNTTLYLANVWYPESDVSGLGEPYAMVGWYDNPSYEGDPIYNGSVVNNPKDEYWAKVVKVDVYQHVPDGGTLEVSLGQSFLVNPGLYYSCSKNSAPPWYQVTIDNYKTYGYLCGGIAEEAGTFEVTYRVSKSLFGESFTHTITLIVTRSSNMVSFSSNGSIIDTQTVDNGGMATPINPELDGYTFKGWYTDNTFSTQFDFSTPITSDITLFAKWEGNFAFTSEPTADGNIRVLSSMNGTVVFDASASKGSLIVWDFGDGTTATGMYQTHFYSQPGTYLVKLMVYNDNGDVDMKEYAVTLADNATGGGGL